MQHDVEPAEPRRRASLATPHAAAPKRRLPSKFGPSSAGQPLAPKALSGRSGITLVALGTSGF